jgi:hypothetical protein
MFVPALRTVFNISAFRWYDWDIVVIAAVMPLLFGELTKVVKAAIRKRRK